jgi:hypothetical protein
MRTANQIAAEMLKKYPFVFRNSCGMAVDKKGHKFRFGLYPGSGDYIGFMDTTDDYHDNKPIFVSIEIKTYSDKLSPRQRKWNSFMMDHCCVVEVWSEDKQGRIVVKTGEEIC